jgi:serine/threonine protein kinase
VDTTRFGRYVLLELLGAGGMGEVWRAHDTGTDRVVALKVLLPHFANDTTFQERFRREAHMAAKINEPHIVPIHNYGEIDGRLFVDMRLIEGEDLGSILDAGALEPARAVEIIQQVGFALNAAHRIGLIHRDIKPSNILVSEHDFAYLIDFGIAQAAGDTSLTSTGMTVGTLTYMAPERFATGQIDSRSDIYALACVLHECLTGEKPFPGTSHEQLLAGHLMSPPPQPSRSRPGLPAAFDAVVARGMAKNPDDRYGSAVELAQAARQALGGVAQDSDVTEQVTAPAPGAAEPKTNVLQPEETLAAPVQQFASAPTQYGQPVPSQPAPSQPRLVQAAPSRSWQQTPPPWQQAPPPWQQTPPPSSGGGQPPVRTPRRQRQILIPVLIAVVVVVVLLVAGVVVFSSTRSKNQAGPTTSATTPPTTVESTPPSSTSVQPSGHNETIADYIKNNNIQETMISHNTPGAPTIDLPVPQGWSTMAESQDAPYGGIKYNTPANPSDAPTIVAIFEKLTGNVNGDTLLSYAPGEVKNLPGYDGSDGEKSTLSGFPAYQLGGNYTKGATQRVIAQKTVVIQAKDGLYVLQLNAEGPESDKTPLMDATTVIDDQTKITTS